jgi:hypothetical protein
MEHQQFQRQLHESPRVYCTWFLNWSDCMILKPIILHVRSKPSITKTSKFTCSLPLHSILRKKGNQWLQKVGWRICHKHRTWSNMREPMCIAVNKHFGSILHEHIHALGVGLVKRHDSKNGAWCHANLPRKPLSRCIRKIILLKLSINPIRKYPSFSFHIPS